MDKKLMLEQMKADLKAMGEIGRKATESGKLPLEDDINKYVWMRRAITPKESQSLANKYGLSIQDFREYMFAFKTLYVGK